MGGLEASSSLVYEDYIIDGAFVLPLNALCVQHDFVLFSVEVSTTCSHVNCVLQCVRLEVLKPD